MGARSAHRSPPPPLCIIPKHTYLNFGVKARRLFIYWLEQKSFPADLLELNLSLVFDERPPVSRCAVISKEIISDHLHNTRNG